MKERLLMSNTYDVIQRQRKERNLLQREMEAEERYLHVLSLTYKDTCQSGIGKNNSQSISIQLNHWIKSMSKKEQLSSLLFVSLDKSLEKFEKYVLDKYSSNKSKSAEFKSLFNNDDYRNDCKRIMIHKIYDFKLDETINNLESGFVSPKAHSIVAFNQQRKEIRSAAHEGMASAYKRLNGPVLPDDLEDMMYNTFERVFNKHLGDLFEINKNQIDSRDHLRLLK
jgi:hypothetical protein